MTKKKSGAARFSEEALLEMMLNNPNLKIAKSISQKELTVQKKSSIKKEFIVKKEPIIQTSSMIADAKNFLLPPKKLTTKKKYNIVDVKGIKETNNNASVEVAYGEDYLALRWHGARLLSVNQIFALLQLSKRKFELFSYKKLWHQMVRRALEQKNNVPFFDSGVELTLFLQSERMVDADSQSVMFKYLIDALKPMKETDEQSAWCGVLSDDDRRIVQSIKPIQIAGTPQVGIRIQRLKVSEAYFNPDDLFK